MKLEGLRVVDLSVFLPGPYLSLAFADHGAEVIKVEQPGEGDPGRHIGLSDGPSTVFFRNLNRGKKSVVLDLKTSRDRERLLELADTADVFIEAFRPGVVARLGVDYATLSARNPRLVYCSISAFGQDGPYRLRPAHDLAVEALGGALSINLGADDRPAMPGIVAADMLASLQALSGVLMALLRRERTGRGDYLDIAMHDATLAAVPNGLGPTFTEGRQPVPKEERSWGGSAFYRLYETQDGRHLALGGQEIKFVRNLLNALGRPDFVPLCEQGPGPHQRPLMAYLEGVFREKPLSHWIEWFKPLDVCFAPVNTLPEALDDEHAAFREMVLTGPDGRRHIAPAIRFQDEPARPVLREPGLGEHNGEFFPDPPGR
ncbi:CaiB/BaiF CoA-transferase family protein [Enterovirga sp.]|jgi:crotonobetainyl-CoA:carnitine CoA-transferase CaiB-like acyl-CoA transferase|uniref:CaiB/BaiF CoA transferase family protein n=1 Tax=Enterovirga sp. TaxID=2026350 RepID=UPI002615BD0E|nr:CaiB/BaiF CoA-transferase family protein [Enterovirga sp.]MDB5592426.1 fldA 1 [Enterovirga sp.]